MFAAGLRKIAPSGDAEFGGNRLQEHGDQAAEEHDAEQRVAEFGAAAEIRGPIPGIHVADGDEIAGAGKREQFSPERRTREDGYGAV